MKDIWDPQLTSREIGAIGMFVIQWGAMEHEVFCQTANSYLEAKEDIPKQLNNIKFTDVLNQWKVRVIDSAGLECANVLQAQINAIQQIYPVRQAIVHGNWEWSTDNPSEITSVRVKNKDVISMSGTVEDIAALNLRLAEINFLIRYPMGNGARLQEMVEQGGFMSRNSRKLLMGDPTAYEDFLPPQKLK